MWRVYRKLKTEIADTGEGPWELAYDAAEFADAEIGHVWFLMSDDGQMIDMESARALLCDDDAMAESIAASERRTIESFAKFHRRYLYRKSFVRYLERWSKNTGRDVRPLVLAMQGNGGGWVDRDAITYITYAYNTGVDVDRLDQFGRIGPAVKGDQ